MPIDDELRALVQNWVGKAKLDLQAAVQLAAGGETFGDAVVFHCQQAVEKYLKALLVRYQVEFRKTHDIEQLLRLVKNVKPEIADSLWDGRWLTPFGVDIRYPGDFPEALAGDQHRALELTQRVQQSVMVEPEPFLNPSARGPFDE